METTTETNILIDSDLNVVTDVVDQEQLTYQNNVVLDNNNDDTKMDSNVLITIIIVCIIIIIILTIVIWILCCRFYHSMTLAGILEQKHKRKIAKIKRKLAKEFSTKYRVKDQTTNITTTSTKRKDNEKQMESTFSTMTTMQPQTIQLNLNHLHKTAESIRNLKIKQQTPTIQQSQHPSLLLSPSKRFESLKSLKIDK